jgi:hypothetical protein
MLECESQSLYLTVMLKGRKKDGTIWLAESLTFSLEKVSFVVPGPTAVKCRTHKSPPPLTPLI